LVGRNVDGFDDPFIDADADAEALAVAAEAEADAAAEEGMVLAASICAGLQVVRGSISISWRWPCSVRRPFAGSVFPSVRQESPTVHHEIGFT